MNQDSAASFTTPQILQVLRDARARLEAVQQARDEPIAVIGMSCRFPQADTLSEFWTLLREGRDGTSEIPADRPEFALFYDPDPGREDRAYTRRGGFLRERPDRFDAHLFGISERETEAMDPQQRLLLEVTWESLEDAGIPPDSLRKTLTGVFLGLSTDDYQLATTTARRPETFSPYAGLGTARSVAAGRISYVYGFQGPCLQVDTACSSSLVAVHLACQSLRTGESSIALAAAVNLILSPISTIGRCRMRAVSPDGRCKAFDASADGYGQGEGCGVIVLKRLSDAQRDGDRIYGLIRGSAVNHDGPSSGLTTPNEGAQEQVIRRALANAKVDAGEISYVEAHGTGTSLGDPIEVNALASVFHGRERPVLIGSVKSNIGHLEAAAGMACLIKTLLALHNGEIPPHLHFRNPNPHIAWSEIPIHVVTEPRSWPTGRRLAGVSGFGLSGTNAHAVLESAPDAPVASASAATPSVLCVSANTRTSLAALVARWVEFLRGTKLPLADICDSANRGRTHFAYRVAVAADSPGEMANRLFEMPLPDAPAEPLDTAPISQSELPVEHLAAHYRRGGEIDWRAVGPGRRFVSIPTYAFDRQRYWSNAVPPLAPESPVQRLLDRGDVRGMMGLLGVSPTADCQSVLERLVALHRGDDFDDSYEVVWEGAAVPEQAAGMAAGWAVEAAVPNALTERMRAWLPVATEAAREVIWILNPDAAPAGQAAGLLARLKTAHARGERIWLLVPGLPPAMAAAIGLGKSAALELPGSWGGVIEVPAEPADEELRSAIQEIQRHDGEPHVRLGNGLREVRRLQRKPLPLARRPVVIQPEADYLITGGTGAVGLHLARWLVAAGARHLVLTGRTGAESPSIDALREQGVSVRVVAMDAADSTAVRRLVASLPQLRGVIHAAGVGGFDSLTEMAEETLQAVLKPKVDGAWELHTATQTATLDFFVLCSSIASVWGSKNQAHYAAGNYFLDSLAAHRRASGLRAVSINWGPWAGTLAPEQEQWLRRSGIFPLAPGEACSALERVLGGDASQVVVAKVDWKVFLNVYESRGPQPFLDRVRPAAALSADRVVPPASLSRSEVVARLQGLVSRVLGVRVVPDPEQGFADLGLDSLMAVELKKLVEESFERHLPATVVFNYPTVDRLADFLMAEASPVLAADPAPSMDARELLALLAKEMEG